MAVWTSVETVVSLAPLARVTEKATTGSLSTVAKARGLRRQVGLYPNPVDGYSAEEIGDEGQAGLQGAFLSQTIVTGDKLDLNRNVVDWEVQSLLWELDAQRLRVRNGVRAQFYRTLAARRRLGKAV